MDKEKKLKTVRRLLPCPNYDVESIESWLTDLAKEGLILTTETSILGFLQFTKDTPQDIRFRLEPKKMTDDEIPDISARELCREFGWEYVVTYAQFYIYRSTSPDAREMNTDPAIHAEALKTIQRQYTFPFSFHFILMISALVRLLREPFRYLTSFGAFYTFGFLFLMLDGILTVVVRAVHIYRLRRKLKANIPLDHCKPWKKWALFHKSSKIMFLLMYIFLLMLMMTQCTRALTSEKIPLTRFPGDPSFVTMADLAPQGTFTPENSLPRYNTYQQWSTGFADTLEWWEYGELVTADGVSCSGFLIVHYHETASPFIAQGLANDYIRDAKRSRYFEETEIPQLDVDYVYTFHDTAKNTIILRQGSTIIMANVLIDTAQGDSLLPLWAEMMAARLQQPG